ncbi:MAG: PQQ-binding-like beta-propeller repeat protein [Candidatus Bathyarchaeota archaeon]|nr:PQQ-binding-like beta-propeller repeat protein [Candidatus Bathyarchaeota archaeon]
MRISKKIASILTVLLLTTSMLSLCIPYAIAQKTPTKAFISVAPHLVGQGQKVYITAWIIPPPPYVGGTAYNYYDLTIEITKPDGSVEDKYFASSMVEGAVSWNYYPEQTGEYSAKLIWPGDEFHEAAESPPISWEVQIENVPGYPSTPLPSGYWDFPISAEYYEWYQISGPWYGARYNASNTHFNPYSTGPNTPHILWANQVVLGGLLGGESGYESVQGSYDETELNVPLSNYVAVQGKLYYTTRAFVEPGTGEEFPAVYPRLHCVDMRTGETVFERILEEPLPPAALGRYAVRPSIWLEATGMQKGGEAARAPNMAGSYSLWVSGGSIREVDPLTGDTLFVLPGVSASLYDDGALYIANYPERGDLSRWDTRAREIVWTVQAPSPSNKWDDLLVISSRDSSTATFKLITINSNTGETVVNKTLDVYMGSAQHTVAYGNIYYTNFDRKVYAASLTTGDIVWTSEEMSYPWGVYQTYAQSAAYGNIYLGMCDGYLYCFDGTTGELEWKFYSGDTTETGYGTYPFWGSIVIADGKVYSATGEHTTPNPYPRGYALYCIDAYTGELVWDYPQFSTYTLAYTAHGQGISAGMLWYQNTVDGRLYLFDKGQTSTTVTAAPKIVTEGCRVLIEGSVMDQSPGNPNTPAIADEYMSEWMQYLYNNAEKPSDATGVSVHLTAIDPNGNFQDIGYTTSDDLGNFAIDWVPPVPGLYTVTATFEGSESYYCSEAGTSFVVSEAAAAAPGVTPAQTAAPTAGTPVQSVSPSPREAPQPSTSAGTPTLTYIAIGVAVIVIVAVAAALIFRRK